MAISRLSNYEELLAYLKENNVPHRPEPADQGVEVAVPQPKDAGSVYIRWEKNLPYINVIYPFAGNVPEARIPDVETAVVRANNVIKLPGFGFDHQNRLLYMRLCVQLYYGAISATAFQRQVFAVLQNAREFGEAFRDVVAGAPGKDICDLAVKHNATPPS